LKKKRRLTIALAGNANVGKSVIFNQLTGLNQVVGNWPGKTVERAEGTLYYKGYRIKVLDLPGTYSLSAYSIEEVIARDYIAMERPDVVVNVVDSSALERNLYLTLQLLELEAPMVVDLNQVDFAAKKGIRIDAEKLSEKLGVPVVPTVAISGKGIDTLLDTIVDVVEGKRKLRPLKVQYCREVEERIERIKKLLEKKAPKLCKKYPSRWLSIKLLEKDSEIESKVRKEGAEDVIELAEIMSEELKDIHGKPAPLLIASERYGLAGSIAREVTEFVHPPRLTLEQRLDELTTHRILGYPILVAVMAAIFTAIFFGGDLLIQPLEYLFDELLIPLVENSLAGLLPESIVYLLSHGVIGGIGAGVTVALPYIVPFYIFLAILEDSGYLPRAAFLMDNIMHRIGLHGKAFIPIVLGYGCSVPACIGCRIMETDRERFIAGLVVMLIPCAARTVVILGLVGRYVGLHAALALYAFDLLLAFLIGRAAFKALPGEPVGLIMEMPPYRRPMVRNILLKTWTRTKDFVYMAFPLIVAGSLILEGLRVSGLIWTLVDAISPIIVGWLGLPPLCGFPLVFGVLRKELTLILLVQLIGTIEINNFLNPIQMVVFSLVTMIYIPCISSIAALIHEYGWRRALIVVFLDISLAMLLGGITYRTLLFLAK